MEMDSKHDGPNDDDNPMYLCGGEGEISSPTFTRYNNRKDLYEFTYKAIDHYNSNHQDDQFELVDPLCLRPVTLYDFRGGPKHYLSFIARRKKSSELKLSFAAFRYPRRVKVCSTVEPGNPLFHVGCGVCHPDGAIYHIYMKCRWECIGGKYSGVVYSGGSRHLSAREVAARKFLRNEFLKSLED